MVRDHLVVVDRGGGRRRGGRVGRRRRGRRRCRRRLPGRVGHTHRAVRVLATREHATGQVVLDRLAVLVRDERDEVDAHQGAVVDELVHLLPGEPARVDERSLAGDAETLGVARAVRRDHRPSLCVGDGRVADEDDARLDVLLLLDLAVGLGVLPRDLGGALHAGAVPVPVGTGVALGEVTPRGELRGLPDHRRCADIVVRIRTGDGECRGVGAAPTDTGHLTGRAVRLLDHADVVRGGGLGVGDLLGVVAVRAGLGTVVEGRQDRLDLVLVGLLDPVLVELDLLVDRVGRRVLGHEVRVVSDLLAGHLLDALDRQFGDGRVVVERAAGREESPRDQHRRRRGDEPLRVDVDVSHGGCLLRRWSGPARARRGRAGSGCGRCPACSGCCAPGRRGRPSAAWTC